MNEPIQPEPAPVTDGTGRREVVERLSREVATWSTELNRRLAEPRSGEARRG